MRVGGEYLAGRQTAHRRVLLWAGAASILTGIVVGVLYDLRVSGLAVLAGGLFMQPVHKKLRSVRRGIEGEATVTELLGRLPDDYFLINDVKLPGSRGNVDHVLIGPCGIVVIETKRYGGVIACRRDYWSVNGRPIGSITRQVTRGAMGVKAFLRRACPALLPTAPVDTIVVFTDPLCRLEIDRATPTVIRLSELLGVVLEKGRRRRLGPTMAATLARLLAHGAQKAEVLSLVPVREAAAS